MAWADWEDGSSLFHRGTGETHLLDVLSAEVVRLLCRRPLPLAEIAALMAAECEVEDAPGWRRKIDAILRDLQALNIVDEGSPPCPASPAYPNTN